MATPAILAHKRMDATQRIAAASARIAKQADIPPPVEPSISRRYAEDYAVASLASIADFLDALADKADAIAAKRQQPPPQQPRPQQGGKR